MESTLPTEVAYCAAHEGAQATGTCPRCGNYLCPLCLDPASARPDHCADCRARVGAEVMAWERPDVPWPKRWARTCRDVLIAPTETLTRTHPGSFWAPVAFNALTAFGMGAFFTLLFGCLFAGVFAVVGGEDLGGLDGGDGAMILGVGAAFLVVYPLIFVVGALLTHAIVAGVYHLAVLALGGKGGIETSSWAVGYLSVAQLANVPIGIVSNVPLVGPFIGLLAWLAVGVWAAFHLTTVARHHHGLEGGRAAMAGWAPVLLATALTLACCLFGAALAFLSES